ncbi:MAG TPA: DUF397 domain-containing protein [Actinophytocola sp.]|jgi:hypothetical protein|uniref:DUF397 domain-containing protein n=1 Tax=Actinophytocola sp. TaxID=1872138 RepID=UPI002E0AC664|nr:DUF397 domain-containing protein [Actinophytocola sp.]
MTNPIFTAWRKSSYSADVSNCVEITFTPAVAVRDSKNVGPTLTFPTTTWTTFLTVLN